MLTPLNKAIAEFTRLKEGAQSIKDMFYLDAVMAVLDTLLEYEKEQIKEAFDSGFVRDPYVDESTGEQYFNETYKQSE